MEENETQKNRESSESKYLEFSIGADSFAIPLLSIKEVISIPETTDIPNSPEYFIGIMNLRGQIISVVDLRKKLKIEASLSEEAVAIVNIGSYQLGLVVDSINKVLQVSSLEEIDNISGLPAHIDTKYIEGIHKGEEKLTVILNLERLLDIEEIKKIA